MENPRIPRYRISLVREGSVEIGKYSRLASSAAVAEVARAVMKDIDREMFAVVTLDQGGKIIGFNVVSIGSLSMSVVHPRETLKMAVLQNAASVIVVHNHPGGTTHPSSEDKDSAHRLEEAAKIMGIRFLDSVIIAPETTEYFSFRDAGLIG